MDGQEMAAEKRCGKCGEVKPLTAFNRRSKARDGLDWWCKACNAAYCRAHHRAHREAMNARSRDRARVARQPRLDEARRVAEHLAAHGLRHCPHCGLDKPIEQFGRDRNNAGGLKRWCKACSTARNRGYRAANPEHARARDRAYERRKPGDAVARQVRYMHKLRSTSPEGWERWRQRHSRYMKISRARNKERIRAWLAANQECVRAAKDRWAVRNPEKRLAVQHARRARQHAAPGRWSPSDIRLIFTAQRGCCAYCLAPLAKPYHIDHMTPVSKGGTNWPYNLCLSCAPCNHRKNARTAGQFLALLIRERRKERTQAAV